MTQDDNNPYEAGVLCFLENGSIGDNPFDKDTQPKENAEWELGFTSAQLAQNEE